MSAMTELEVKEQIRELLYRYCFSIDARDLDTWAQLFTEDAEMSPLPGEKCVGRRAIHDWMDANLPASGAGPSRVHLTLNSLIDLDGDDNAHVLSNVLVVMQGDAGPIVTLAGRYDDEVRREGTTWRFSLRTVLFDVVARDLGLNSE